MKVQHICKCIIFYFMLTSNHYQVISTRANNTTEAQIVDSQFVLNDDVNEQVPVKTAMPLEVYDQSYDVTKWVSFVGCGLWSFSRYYTQTEAEQTFREYFNDELVRAEDTYDCSLKCSMKTNEKFFSFFKEMCKCTGITSSDVNRDNINCLGKCVHLGDVYCNGERGFPIFEKQNVTQARVNWFGIRLPRLDSLQIGQCFVQENGAYHTRQVSVLIQKIKSNTCGNKFNVIYPLLFGRFIQWICEENIKYFRIVMGLDRTTENALTVDREDDLQVTTISIHDNVSDLDAEKTTGPDTSAMTTYKQTMLIGNAVLFIALLMVGTVYCIMQSRLRQGAQSGHNKTPENTEQNMMQRETHYDTVGSVAGSCPIPISNQTYNEVNI